jgi:hypothetical protein
MSCANGKNREAEKWPKSPVQIRNARQSQSSPTGPSSNHLPSLSTPLQLLRLLTLYLLRTNSAPAQTRWKGKSTSMVSDLNQQKFRQKLLYASESVEKCVIRFDC